MAKRDYPFTFVDWAAGIDGAYRLLEDAERARATGEQLSREDQCMLPAARLLVSKYKRDGRKKKPKHMNINRAL